MPYFCEQCQAPAKSKFCSSSCSAKFNNARRTKESRERQRQTVTKTYRAKPKFFEIAGPYSKVFCNVCPISGKVFFSKTWRRFHPDLKATKDQYTSACRFRFSISEYPEWFSYGSELIEKYGWYSTPGSRKGIKNLNGVSRDHMISASEGFKLGIDTKLLSHPANLQLLRHTQNQNKRTRSSITLHELKRRIAYFEEIYG